MKNNVSRKLFLSPADFAPFADTSKLARGVEQKPRKNFTLVTLTGPSCSGKSTLEKQLVAEGAGAVISNTSRAPRPGEVEGVDYHFRTREWFAKQDLIECVEFGSNLYGNTESDIQDALIRSKNNMIVWVVEPNGLMQIREYYDSKSDKSPLYAVFIDGDIIELANRFLRRFLSDSTNNVEAYSKRLTQMMTTEREWVNKRFECCAHSATPDRPMYDIVLPEFNKLNKDGVTEFICSIAKMRSLAELIESSAQATVKPPVSGDNREAAPVSVDSLIRMVYEGAKLPVEKEFVYVAEGILAKLLAVAVPASDWSIRQQRK